MKWSELQNNGCPVARGLSVVGDRWTMLVIRECFMGVRRFDKMQQGLGITRHVLADRLRMLEARGVLRRDAYQERPPRYEYRLTAAGKALYPVIVTLIDWAEAHVPVEGGSSVRLVAHDTLEPVVPKLIDARSNMEITPATVIALSAD